VNNIACCGLTDIGLVRKQNQDVWAEESGTYFLADGMGGHNAGGIAAQCTIDLMCQWARSLHSYNSINDFTDSLKAAIIDTNNQIYDKGCLEKDLSGMGTTLCCLAFFDGRVVYAHLGDSRVYRLRKGSLQLLTKDHSLLNNLLDAGKIKDEKDFKYNHIISKALGLKRFEFPDIEHDSVRKGDLYLLCSDGISDYISHGLLGGILKSRKNIENKGKDLIIAAKDGGGRDNITAILVKVQ
jgi:PPM family protein phosphatase